MSSAILATKLYAPLHQPDAVRRPHLTERLNAGLHRKLTLVSAPAGFGKTTIVSEWISGCQRPAAWLSLDEADSDMTRFLTYLIAALQSVEPTIGRGVMNALQSPQPPAIEPVLTALLNDIAALCDSFTLVLDDYHVVDARPVDDALAFLIDHLPPQLHLVITTREDPRLPLARLRARGQLTELRASDLRFTTSETAAFLNQGMGLNLSDDDIAALDARTEGWIAGLQLAAISMRGSDDATSFITSFTGSHRFVLDYLVEEVLQQQPEHIQAFLLRTSILDRLCGPLCDALVIEASISGRETLEYLERANLFLVPLDDERRWYRYHHLFAELLRQRLHQRVEATAGTPESGVAALHVRASEWFEASGLEIEAFHHATVANDVERAQRLIEGTGMPLYLRGGVAPILTWLESLPEPELDARPSLWVMFASAIAVIGRLFSVEPKLVAAEAALNDVAPDDETQNLRERIASIRSMLALMSGDPSQMDTIIAESRRALTYLDPDNLRERASTIWRMGLAYQNQGYRTTARDAFVDAIAACELSGNVHINIMATTCLGRLQEGDNQLHQAAETFRRVLQLVGDPPGPVACEAYVGLGRLAYEWNHLDTAYRHGRQSVTLARQVDHSSFIASELLLARLHVARGDATGALASLAETEQAVLERNLWFRLPEINAAQVRVLVGQGNLAEADHLARKYDLAISQARVHLSCGDAAAALAVLEPWRQRVEANGWEDERLRAIVLQSVAHHANGDHDMAIQRLVEALALAEPGGFVRLFIDEGPAMAHLLTEAIARGIRPDYARRLLTAYEAEGQVSRDTALPPPAEPAQPLIEPLSQRELEVLRLIADGRSNREISDRLFLALNTVKGHNRVIFSKLQVQRRTEAVARARELNLI